MTENMDRDQVPNDLHPDTHSRDQLVEAAEAAGIKVSARATKADIFAAITLDLTASRDQLVEAAQAEGVDVRTRATKAEIFAAITEARNQNVAEAAGPGDTDSDTEEVPAVEDQPQVDLSHIPEDYEDEDEQTDAAPQWGDDGVAPGASVFEPGLTGSPQAASASSSNFRGLVDRIKSQARPSSRRSIDFRAMTDKVKARFSSINFRSWKTWLVIAIAIAIAIIVSLVITLVNNVSDDGASDDVVTPEVTVDPAFAGLCETDGNVDLTAMPVVGDSFNASEAADSDAATVQTRVVDGYFADSGLACSGQGVEFLRSGVDAERIDANRGLDTSDSAGRIAYYSEHPDEAAVLAEYLQDVMSDCAAEMVVLDDADIQEGLYALHFEDSSYSDLVWVKLPVETALSGVDSLEVLRCTIGLVEGSDGLTRSFMYSEDLSTFVSVETPHGDTVEYVPATVDETATAPVTPTTAPEAPEVETEDQDQAPETETPTVDEPQDESDTQDESTPEPTPEAPEAPVTPETQDTKTEGQPKDKPKTDDKPKDQPKADTKDESKDKGKTETPAEDAETTTDVKPETPAEDTSQTTTVQPETPAEDGAQAPAVPADAGDLGVIPGNGGCTGACGGPNEDGSSGGNGPGNGPANGGPGGCVGVCVGQGGDTGGGPGNGPGDGPGGGCTIDCDGPGGDEPEDVPEDEPELPQEEPEDVCEPPNTLDAFGNCKAPPEDGAVDL